MENEDQHKPSDPDAFASDVLAMAQELALEIADVAGNVDAVTRFVARQWRKVCRRLLMPVISQMRLPAMSVPK